MVADHAAARRRRATAAAGARGPPRRGRRSARAASVVGQVEEDALDLLVDRRGQQRQRLVGWAPRARRPGRSASEPSTVCMRADDRAERRAGASTKRLGVVARARRAPAPSRRGAPATKLLHDAERRVHQLALVLRTSRRAAAMCAKPRSVRKRSISSSGLSPGLDAAEGLQHQRVVEDDRGVGLLDADRAHVGAGPRRLDARRASGTRRARARRATSRRRAAGRRAARGRRGSASAS